jgi:hypothetical protein
MAADPAELERMLCERGVGTADDIEGAKRESQGWVFSSVRSSVSIGKPRRRRAPAFSLGGRRARSKSNSWT